MKASKIRVLVAIFGLLLPLGASAANKADREAIKATVNDIIGRTVLGKSRVSVLVSSLDDGSVVFTRNPDDLLNPASNVKLFTTAAALSLLGPEFRFETEFLADRPPNATGAKPNILVKGKVEGPLYVRGKGDPTLTTEKLFGLVNELSHVGLREVSGDLVLDDSYFDPTTVGPGYEQERSDRSYLAPSGALSLNWNAAGIWVHPADVPGQAAKVEVDPPSDFFVVENRAVTGPARGYKRLFISSQPLGDKQKVVVAGRVPFGYGPSAAWKKIDNPTMYFGNTLRAMLEAKGIHVKGKVRRGVAPKDAVAVYVHTSETLDLVLKRVNKNSSNFTAEQLLRTMGAQFKGAGSWPAGVSVVEEFLAQEVGIPKGTFVMQNGSGLNDANRFSVAQIGKLLAYMWGRFPLAPEYLSSLGIAGKDGTVHYRMEGTDAVGRLRAKTGTLENVCALSGYVQAVGGEKFVFSVLVNDYPGRSGPVVQALDTVGAAIAEIGGPGGPAAGAALALGNPAGALTALADLKNKLATYDAVVGRADKKDVPFLRTALRTETDPALKAYLGEAVYRADPESGTGERLLLDNFDASPDVLGRLRAALAGSGKPTPLLGSLARIAAEGNSDAMARLVEVAALTRTDDPLKQELLEPVTEVARTAPDELIGALKVAREVTREAALDLIAVALSKAAEPDHPFPLAVKRTLGAVDPDLATFAKALDAGLSVRIAAEKAPRPEVVPAQQIVNVPAPVAREPKPPAPPDIRPGG